MSKPQVSIVMGSDSDLEIMRETGKALDEFGIAYEIDVTSAHRSPDRTADFARKAAERGIRVIIAGAGGGAVVRGGGLATCPGAARGRGAGQASGEQDRGVRALIRCGGTARTALG